jgi:hypothetical protein
VLLAGEALIRTGRTRLEKTKLPVIKQVRQARQAVAERRFEKLQTALPEIQVSVRRVGEQIKTVPERFEPVTEFPQIIPRGKKAQVGVPPREKVGLSPAELRRVREPRLGGRRRDVVPSKITPSDVGVTRPSFISPSVFKPSKPSVIPSGITPPVSPRGGRPFEPSGFVPEPPVEKPVPPITPSPIPPPSKIRPPKAEIVSPPIVVRKGFEEFSVPTRRKKRRKVLRPKPGLPRGLGGIRSERIFRRTPSFAGVTLPQLGFDVPKVGRGLEETGLAVRGFERPVEFGTLLGTVRKKKKGKKNKR